MCICAIAWQLCRNKPLVLLANRDEFFARPTAPLQPWQNSPAITGIVAGQDLVAGGTWLGINPLNQKWAVILNFRDSVKDNSSFMTSRGQIISDFLTSDLSPLAFAKRLNLTDFAGFNLILGDSEQAVMLNNKGFPITVLGNGLYTVSNGQPEGFEKADSWFKTDRLRLRIRQEVLPLIETGQNFIDASFNVLADNTQAPLDRLPDTGVSSQLELALSSIFIAPDRLDNVFSQPYGTRCSSLLWLEDQKFEFYEKTFLENRENFLTHFS